MTRVLLCPGDPAAVAVDAIVVGVGQVGGGLTLAPGAGSVDRAVPGGLVAALASVGATGRLDEVTRIPTLGCLPARSIVAVGLGPVAGDGTYPDDVLRRGAGAALRALDGLDRVWVCLSAVDVAAEGALLGAYRFGRFRTRPALAPPVAEVLLPAAPTEAARAAVRRAGMLAAAVALCRDLVNLPANELHPVDLAEVAVREGAAAGLRVDVYDEAALAAAGDGGLLGVGSGSVHPPCLVRIGYGPDSPVRERPALHLVGKGVTFDAGGLSLKSPPERMTVMKCDMAGAAAVLAAMTAIGRLAPSGPVVGWLACAENVPSGSAIRPSDVLTLHSGHTVEVTDTDAEGRLMLADAIARAGAEQPSGIVDVATLTGEQMVALGTRTAAVMGSDQPLTEAIRRAAAAAGEAVWPMPLPEHLREELHSEIADLRNLGAERGGMLTAGLFLREFVPAGVPWAHLDIAGPAYNAGPAWGYTPHGGTGAMVRTLVELVARSSQPN